MATIQKTVRLHRAQAAFRRSPALYRGFVGGRGAGKTWVGSYDVLRRARRGRLYMVVSPTYTVLQDTTFRTLTTIARELGVIDAESIRKSPPALRLTTGAEILLRSADDPERLRGPNLSGVWMDEASLMHRDAYDIAIACLREQGERGWLSATFTPKGMGHWTHDVFGKPRPDTELFHASTRENPFAPPGFYDGLKLQYSGLRAAQELEGRFVQFEGAEWPPDYFGPHIWAKEFPDTFVASALALDPAQGKGEGKCYSAFVFVGIDRQATLWLDAWMGNDWAAPRLVEESFRLVAEMRPGGFSVEINGGQRFFADLLLSEARRRNVVLPLFAVNNTVDKEVRIREWGPHLAQQKVRVRDTPGGRLLVQQFMDFPEGEYRDGPDAAQQALKVLRHLLGQKDGRDQPTILRA